MRLAVDKGRPAPFAAQKRAFRGLEPRDPGGVGIFGRRNRPFGNRGFSLLFPAPWPGHFGSSYFTPSVAPGVVVCSDRTTIRPLVMQ
jgi:hypothetical protein